MASRDVDAKAKEIFFLKDRVCQLEMQVSIPQKQHAKKGTKPRYEVRERLLILWHMEAFQIPRRTVSRYFGIARSTLLPSPARARPEGRLKAKSSRLTGTGSPFHGRIPHSSIRVGRAK